MEWLFSFIVLTPLCNLNNRLNSDICHKSYLIQKKKKPHINQIINTKLLHKKKKRKLHVFFNSFPWSPDSHLLFLLIFANSNTRKKKAKNLVFCHDKLRQTYSTKQMLDDFITKTDSIDCIPSGPERRNKRLTFGEVHWKEIRSILHIRYRR